MEEFKDGYGVNLSDTELRDAVRADMLEHMEAQLASWTSWASPT